MIRFAIVILGLCAAEAAAQRTVIRPGMLLDVERGRLTSDAVVIVEGGRIQAIARRNEVETSAADRVIDLPDQTLLPGLIDAHVHLAIGGPPRANATADLRAGFTTIVDLGSQTTRLLAIRDSINAGHIEGPRVLAAGIWVGVQGGTCEFNGIGIAGGTDGFRARVRENAAAGAELIKACVSGWLGAAYANPEGYEMPDSILAAIVDESRRLGRIVIAHDISHGGVRAALRTGVRGLAHGAYVDTATADAILGLKAIAGGDSIHEQPGAHEQPYMVVEPVRGPAEPLGELRDGCRSAGLDPINHALAQRRREEPNGLRIADVVGPTHGRSSHGTTPRLFLYGEANRHLS